MASRNTRNHPRPKRAGEEFTRLHHGDNAPSNKKPRFDYRNPSTLAPDTQDDVDDSVLDIDEIGKKGQGVKRHAVNIDGFESDSSDDNFDERAKEKAELNKSANGKGSRRGKTQEEDENDMFADLDENNADGDEDEDLAREGKGKKKEVRFLAEDEIEGQERDSRAGGHVSADFSLKGKQVDRDGDSSSESGDDEERDRITEDVDEEVGAGGKKKHAPKLDAFNMRAEAEEGRFDEAGNFVRKAADPDAVHDSWLEGLSKKDMKAAKEAEEKRAEERRKKALADDSMVTSDLLGTLISRLDKGETVLEALARLNVGKEKKKPKWQKNKRKDSNEMDVDKTKSTDPADAKRKEAVEAITGAADELFSRGQGDIYDSERELLMRQYRRETGQDWVEAPQAESNEDTTAPSEVKHWEYRWSDARNGGEIHGPYDGPTMQAWNAAGYFGEGVEFRRVGESSWSRLVDFV